MAIPIMMIAGAALSAVAAKQRGDAAARAGEYNAAIAERNAGVVMDQAKASATSQHQDAERVLGDIRAGYGGSGVTSDSGNALDVLAESASQAELDRQNILYRGQLQAMGYLEDASLDRMSASSAEESGTLGAAAALMSGAAQAYTYRPLRQPTQYYGKGVDPSANHHVRSAY